ncbi:hypothetical protein BDR07DRAFT_1379412 [Suillus spraguei]|nr:hypothetical protein BDR07DRAFT_1379412 [Suillus spraguei]
MNANNSSNSGELVNPHARHHKCFLGVFCPFFLSMQVSPWLIILLLDYKQREKSTIVIIKRVKLTKRLPMFQESILAKRHQSQKEKKSCQGNEPSDDEDEPIETLQDCIATVKYTKDDFMAYVKILQNNAQTRVTPYHKWRQVCIEHAIASLEDFLDRANMGLMVYFRCVEFMREMMGMIKDILLRLVEGGDSELSIAFMGNELWYQEYKFPI